MDDRTVANELRTGSSQSSLACKSCRKKKLRCDRKVPQCYHCEQASRNCEYPAVAHKPGPRPGTHRRAGAKDQVRTLKNRSIDHGAPNTQSSNRSSDYTQSSGKSTMSGYDTNSLSTSTSHFTPDSSISYVSSSWSPKNPMLLSACQLMGISERFCLKMIDIYFKTMTTFTLFHQPSFLVKLGSIQSARDIQALLTTMFAYSCRFTDTEDASLQGLTPNGLSESGHLMSCECLRDCGDEKPPLHLLQAFILQAHLFSMSGVRGRAWRLVGQCIRMAYELRLHELDIESSEKDVLTVPSVTQSSNDWINTEEKRRAWWAVWECDVFASTILRLPNGVDWTRNRTNLPCSYEDWLNGRLSKSCHLLADPNKRWKHLRDSGNQSPIAWFILLNSYKWETLSATQRISPPTTYFDSEDLFQTHLGPNDYKSVFLRKRETLANCLRCAIAAIPASLQLRGFLAFEPFPGPYPSTSLIHDHYTYMVHMMGHIAQLLLSRKDLQGGDFIAYPADLTQPPTSTNEHTSKPDYAGRTRWQHCLLIADKMTALVRNASPDHHRYVNPNAATALWMAAATQLAVLAYHRDEIDVQLARSNLDLLTTTIESFISFWGAPSTLVSSLEALEKRLWASSNKYSSVSRAQSSSMAMSTNVDQIGGIATTHQSAEMPEMPEMQGMTYAGSDLDLSPFDVLQAMDFGAMYNGVDGWENLFLDPGFSSTDSLY